MEAFSPLNFLKSILSSPDFLAQNSAESSKKEASTPEQTEQEKSAPPVEKSTAQNAFTSFIEAHEKRARRIKR